MKKRIMIISISAFVMVALCVSVFAAFMFNKKINGKDNTTGDIEIVNQKYVNYALNNKVSQKDDNNIPIFSSLEYKAILRERAGVSKVYVDETDTSTDKFVVTDNNISNYYQPVETDTFDSNKINYIKDTLGNFIYTDEAISSEKYYVFVTATDSKKECYRLGHQFVSITADNYLTNTFYTLESVDGAGYGIYVLESGDFDSNKKYFKIVSSPDLFDASDVIGSGDNAGLKCVNTYATERNLNEFEENYLYLNQLGFKFEIKSEVKSYLRVKFFDAWISSKLYPGSSSPKENYIKKDQINGISPFAITAENWKYDQTNNCCYLLIPLEASDEPREYTFNINDMYFYNTTASVYTENIYVQVSYSIDVIQANRAAAVWNFDPSTSE